MTDIVRTVRRLEATVRQLAASTQQASVTTGALSIGATDVTVTWPTPWADTTYGVYVELVTGGSVLGNVHATLKAKTVNDCTITVGATVGVGGVILGVLGVRK